MYELILELMGKGTHWDYVQREIRIGRDPNCDLVLPTNEYPMVSRSHLLIRLAADRYWVEDLNTPGGTFVNGERIQVAPLSSEDVLRLGTDGPQLRVRVSVAGRSESPPVRRTSSSEEAPTRLRDGIPAKSSEEAPTNSRGTSGYRSIEGAQAETALGRETEEDDTSAARILLDSTPSPASQAPPEIVSPGAASWASPPAPTLGETESEKTPPKSSVTSTLHAAINEPVSPHGAAIIEQKLNVVRNLLILIVVLIIILGIMLCIKHG